MSLYHCPRINSTAFASFIKFFVPRGALLPNTKISGADRPVPLSLSKKFSANRWTGEQTLPPQPPQRVFAEIFRIFRAQQLSRARHTCRRARLEARKSFDPLDFSKALSTARPPLHGREAAAFRITLGRDTLRAAVSARPAASERLSRFTGGSAPARALCR